MTADPSDLLSPNMAAQLSSWPIRIYFPNPGKSRDGRVDEAVSNSFGIYNYRRVTYQDLESINFIKVAPCNFRIHALFHTVII